MSGTLIVLRHADAGSRSRWEGPDEERPLSPVGRSQADALVERLAAFSPARVLSSPYLRCVQSVAPLAGKMGLTVELEPALKEGAGAAIMEVALSQNGTVLACTHGDVMQAILGSLRARGVPLPPVLRDSKASAWILKHSEGAVTSARYLERPQV